ncbi:MAG: ribosome silencing factor [Chloroflexota bacterium]|nr:ribosome silencing factor [Chloroflexota bacterium]
MPIGYKRRQRLASGGARSLRPPIIGAGVEYLEPLDAARIAVDAASDRQADDILLLNVGEVAAFADFLLIMSAGSPRQMGALADEIELAMKRGGCALHHREGSVESGWVLLDFSDVVVHVFSEEQRAYYRLEEVWSAGKPVVRIQ